MANGRLYISDADIGALAGPGGQQNATLAFNRFYSSSDSTNGPLGIGWTHNYNVSLNGGYAGATVRTWDGEQITYTLTMDGYFPDAKVDSTLTNIGGNLVWILKHDTAYTFDHSNNNRLINISERKGNSITLAYNDQGWLSTVTDGPGRQLVFVYNADGTIHYVIDPSGNTNTYTYSSFHLISASDSKGTKAIYLYLDPDHPNGITEVEDGNGNPRYYTYDAAGDVQTATKASGLVQTYTYDVISNVTTVTVNGQTNQTVKLDSNAQIVEVVDPAGTNTYLRDMTTTVVTNTTDHMGNKTTIGYDTNKNPVVTVTALLKTNAVNIGAHNLTIALTNAVGAVAAWQRDSKGNVTNATDACGNTSTFTYDASGNLLSITDPNNNTVQKAYDQFGNCTNVTDALSHSTSLGYDIRGRLINRTDPLGRTDSLVWDVRNCLSRWIDAAGETNLWTTDGNDNVLSWRDGLGHTMSFGYNWFHQLTSITLPGSPNAFVTFGFDQWYNRTNITDAMGNGTTFGYNWLRQVTSVTDALSNEWIISRNPNGCITVVIDPNNHTNEFAYDSMNRRTAWTNALGQVATYVYDGLGNLSTVTDARTNSVLFEFASCTNRLRRITYPDTTIQRLEYDGVGNMTNYINRAGEMVALTYDAANRLSQKAYAGTTGVIGFGYDAANQLTGMVWTAGTQTNSVVAYGYDSTGRLTNEVQVVGQTTPLSVGYQYYADGRRKQLTYPDGTFITYQYNANGWLTAILDSGTSTVVGYGYDAAGRRTNRTVSANLNRSLVTVYNYDNVNHLTNVCNQQVFGTTIVTNSQYGYGYDAVGNRTWVKRAQQSNLGDVYAYDAANQLTNVEYNATHPDTVTPSAWNNQTCYAFDAAGNRTNVAQITGLPASPVTNLTAYAANNLNEFTNVGGTNLIYDAKGDLTSDGVWTYTYDYENRLSSASNATMVIVYTHDAAGRLVRRQTSGASASTNVFCYAGWQLIAEYDGVGNLQAKYVYGIDIDEPVRMQRGSTKFFFDSDGLGSVTELANSLGSVVERYSYDVYGTPTIYNAGGTIVTASAYNNRLMFTGRDRDPDTGLYNYRLRYYSPGLGRFMQPDPAGLSGGDLNWYRYCQNNPMKWLDAFGLRSGWTRWKEGLIGGAKLLTGIGLAFGDAPAPWLIPLTAATSIGLIIKGGMDILDAVNDGSDTLATNIDNMPTTPMEDLSYAAWGDIGPGDLAEDFLFLGADCYYDASAYDKALDLTWLDYDMEDVDDPCP
ncbi:MAG: RHS repeat-associated core domain-containing protein [Verrucomicrobiia bacterium]